MLLPSVVSHTLHRAKSVFPLAGLLVLIAGAFRDGEFDQIWVALVALRIVGESAFEGCAWDWHVLNLPLNL